MFYLNLWSSWNWVSCGESWKPLLPIFLTDFVCCYKTIQQLNGVEKNSVAISFMLNHNLTGLVRPGFKPATSCSADRRSPNWANQAAVTRDMSRAPNQSFRHKIRGPQDLLLEKISFFYSSRSPSERYCQSIIYPEDTFDLGLNPLRTPVPSPRSFFFLSTSLWAVPTIWTAGTGHTRNFF